jgi:hypothetical protein
MSSRAAGFILSNTPESSDAVLLVYGAVPEDDRTSKRREADRSSPESKIALMWLSG